MEQRLSLRAQREVWSALVRQLHTTGDRRPDAQAQAAMRLARQFLQCAERKRSSASDAVSCSLAHMIVAASDGTAPHSLEVDDNESLASIKRDAAFKEAIKFFTLTRLAVPAAEQLASLSTRPLVLSKDGVTATQDQAQAQRTVLLRFTRVPRPTATPGAEDKRPRGVPSTSDHSRSRAIDGEEQALASKRARLDVSATQRGDQNTQPSSQDDELVIPATPVQLSLEVRLPSCVDSGLCTWSARCFVSMSPARLCAYSDGREGDEARQTARER